MSTHNIQTEEADIRLVTELKNSAQMLRKEMAKRIIGQKDVVEALLYTLFSGGHSIFVGVPGLAKTLLVQTLSECLGLDYKRIQFTPDLMPSDMTGSDVLEEDPISGKRIFRFIKGPVFTNILLADEINRTPPKTQAALLQAMQEKQVTAGGQTYNLDAPFFVFATQNPIEQEGTYPLPEAQLDRFMFMIPVNYPSKLEEEKIVGNTTSGQIVALNKVLNKELLLAFQALIKRAPVADHLIEYAVRLVRATRPNTEEQAKESIHATAKQFLRFGAGPRASQYLIMAAKSKALIEGRFTPQKSDIEAVALLVLAHRLVRNFEAMNQSMSQSDIVRLILKEVNET